MQNKNGLSASKNTKQLTKQHKQLTPKGGYFHREQQEFSKWKAHHEKSKGLGLETTLTYQEWETIIEAFGNRCAISFSFNHSLEHFIPQSIGGGTTKENCYPMDLDLNISKNNNHPFHWFEDNKHKIDVALWDELVNYLASQNEMDVPTYRRYVDFCFARRMCDKQQFQREDRRHQTQLKLFSILSEQFNLTELGMSDFVEFCYKSKLIIGMNSYQVWENEK